MRRIDELDETPQEASFRAEARQWIRASAGAREDLGRAPSRRFC